MSTCPLLMNSPTQIVNYEKIHSESAFVRFMLKKTRSCDQGLNVCHKKDASFNALVMILTSRMAKLYISCYVTKELFVHNT